MAVGMLAIYIAFRLPKGEKVMNRGLGTALAVRRPVEGSVSRDVGRMIIYRALSHFI